MSDHQKPAASLYPAVQGGGGGGGGPPPPNYAYSTAAPAAAGGGGGSSGGTSSVGSKPTNMVCPQCHQQVVSRLKPTAGIVTWVSAVLCIVFGCVCGCCLIPFCMDGFQDVEHYCPQCNAFLGRHRRL